MTERLTRTDPAPRVRIVHLGLGNFFRAHQAWFTHHANEGLPVEEQWGIAAFTGMGNGLPRLLQEQDGLYTLLLDDADKATTEVIASVVDARTGEDLGAWRDYIADPEVAIITITVTEAGYYRAPDGGLDLGNDAVRADLEAWRQGDQDSLTTTPVRIVSGLAARRAAGSGGLTIVPCDNLPGNARVAREVVMGAAEQLDPALADWVRENVTFVSTAVDRITPRPTEEDQQRVRELTGVDDPAAVVTEPFVEWDLAAEFVAGRPAWEKVGAVFTDDVRPYETRKLWLLNGAHSLLAYAGSIRGHETVAEAVSDPEVSDWVKEWWEVALPELELPEDVLRPYTEALLDRFANPKIRHLLAQIAADGMQKIPVRIVPALKQAHEAGRDVDGALRAVAAWILHARGAGVPLTDAAEDQARALVEGDLPEATTRVLRHWGIDESLTDRTVELAAEVGGV